MMTTATLYEPLGAVIASYRAFLVSRLLTGCLKKRMPSNQDPSTKGFQGPLGRREPEKALCDQCWGWGWGTLPANLNFQTQQEGHKCASQGLLARGQGVGAGEAEQQWQDLRAGFSYFFLPPLSLSARWMTAPLAML